MSTPDVYTSDIGTVVRYRFMEDGSGVDITGADEVTFRWVAPDGSAVFDVDATIIDAENGLAEYTTLADHWRGIAGLWHLYPRAVVEVDARQYNGLPRQIKVVAVPEATE
jgi:hypothetical protein